MAKMCSLFSQQARKTLNLMPLECQITSQQRLNIGLKRPNVTVSQIDVSPSLRRATAVSSEAEQIFFQKRAKLRVKQTEKQKHK